MENGFYVSTDKTKLNIDLIHNFLSNDSYWAKGRTLATVRKSIDHSLCFGVFKGNNQVGFARVVSDHSVFAWILDVFILEEYRKKGLGKMLMDAIINHGSLQNLQRWGLGTDDAHGLYEQYGFQKIKRPEMFMEIVSPPS
jgi:GNAT superfamily N-acetyltransferase